EKRARYALQRYLAAERYELGAGALDAVHRLIGRIEEERRRQAVFRAHRDAEARTQPLHLLVVALGQRDLHTLDDLLSLGRTGLDHDQPELVAAQAVGAFGA